MIAVVALHEAGGSHRAITFYVLRACPCDAVSTELQPQR